MDPAIAQLLVMQVGLFGPLPGQFLDPRNGFSFLFRLLDLPQQDMSCFTMFVQVIIQSWW